MESFTVGATVGVAVCEGGGGSAACGDGGGRLMVPVSTRGVTTSPTLPLTENTSVSATDATPLPVSNWKLIVWPGLSAYRVI